MVWVNTIDPWSVQWIKAVVDGPDTCRATHHLRSFVHESRLSEVDSSLVVDLRRLSPDDAHWVLRDLQHRPKFICRTTTPAHRDSLELAASLVTSDSRDFAVTVLVDSGCTGSSIDRGFVAEKGLATHRLPRSIPVYNADGTQNSAGRIEEFVTVELRIQDHSEQIALAVTNLGTNTVFLGHDWLRLHNPRIDWQQGLVEFQCEDDHMPGLLDVDDDDDDDDDEHVNFHDGERLFQLKVDSYVRAVSTDIAAALNQQKPKKTFKEAVPVHYHDYEDVFAKENFDELPPRRPWDHAIELIPGDHVIDCKTYNLSPDEQKELDEFLEENLQSGRIRPSKSPFASPFFFVKKKDGRLRPVQDYRKLNAITVKNRYPLPLVSELVDKLKSAKYFTKLDIRWGYNNVRLVDGDEWKAAFRTNRGLFEPLVMFFGLSNSPATFQTMMNSLFRDLINRGKVVIYMDDIMIFTTTLKEHRSVVREVLQILRENKLYLKHEKCDFEALETEYLGLVVAENTVKMDPAKVSAVVDWPTPRSKKELRGFLGFLNFYRRFIKNFTQIARPLNALTSVNKTFLWDDACHSAFTQLKTALSSAPTLTMPTNDAPYRVETDASGFGIGAVLSQRQGDVWRPVAFISRSLGDAERNYHAADLEMLAVIFALKEWRHYLLGAHLPFEVLTDHKNLEFFRKPQDLSRRQARWQQVLQEYDLVLTHRPGKTNPADPLSRRPDFAEGVALDNSQKTLLPSHLFDEKRLLIARSSRPSQPLQDAEGPPEDPMSRAPSPPPESHPHSVEAAIHKNQYKRERYVREGLARTDSPWQERGGVVHWNDLLYVPNEPTLRERILQEHHDHPLAGHPGIRRTRDLIMDKYYWPSLRRDIERYVRGCDTCQKVKPKAISRRTPLHPNATPGAPWEEISVDIIGPLPDSNGKNAILNVVDRFSKMIHVFPVHETITSLGVAKIFRDHVFKLHGLPLKVISDRGPQFVSSFMTDLYKLLRIERNPSTAYHPQTDGQTERLNAEVEQYLRIYTNHRQTDWADWLPLAEFAHNQRTSSATGYSPFQLVYGQQPLMNIDRRRTVRNPSADDFVLHMKQTQDEARLALEHASADMKRFHDRHARPPHAYLPGDLVLLEATNIRSDRPSRKLDDKRYGPFSVVAKVGQGAYKLKLDRSWRGIHPVFNECLLWPYTPGTFPSQRAPPPPPPTLVNQAEEQEIEAILDSRERRGQVEYLVHWRGFPREEREWKRHSDLPHAQAAVALFHRQHPTAPRPQPRLRLRAVSAAVDVSP